MPTVTVSISLGGLAVRSITNSLLSGATFHAVPSCTITTEFATSASLPSAVICRLVGGPSSEFINGIDHNYPGPDYDDLMAGVDTVVGRGYIDTSRMYVSGCSGGGVLSSWVIGHTDRFAAAAVRCPVIDWLSMAGNTDVPLFTYSFFKKPFWEDPSDWLAHSSLMSVGKVTTPTLLMTGVLDRRTPMPQTEEYYSALKMKGVDVKLEESTYTLGKVLTFNAARERFTGDSAEAANALLTRPYRKPFLVPEKV